MVLVDDIGQVVAGQVAIECWENFRHSLFILSVDLLQGVINRADPVLPLAEFGQLLVVHRRRGQHRAIGQY